MIVCGTALVIATGIFIISNLFSVRRSFKEEFLNIARVTEVNCVAALRNSDPKFVAEYLTMFRALPNLKHAFVLTPNKQIFAAYPSINLKNRIGQNQLQAQLEPFVFEAKLTPQGNYKFFGKYFYLAKPIVFKGENIGWIYLSGEMNNFYKHLKNDILLCLFIIILCSSIAFLLSKILQSKISAPILNLIAAMDQVSKNKDYGLRVEHLQKDEIGALSKGFNEMLAQIQEQDRALRFVQYSIEHMSDAVFWTQPTGVILYANTAACRKLGYSTEELSKMSVLEIDVEITQEKYDEIWREIGIDDDYCIESSLKTKSGDTFPVEITIIRVDFKGESYHCCFAKDIRRRKQMEVKLKQLQKMEAIGRLTVEVAHDLNNVLSGLISYPELLLMEIPEEGHFHDIILNIQKSGQKAADVVRDLLILARRNAVDPKTTYLNEIIAEVLNSIEFSSLRSCYPNIKIVRELAEDIQNITGYKIHIEKTIMNLVTNAYKNMPSGGQLKIKTENRCIKHLYNGFEQIETGDYVVLTVSDSGIGIPDENLKRIFEPFFTKKVMGCSGTGLEMPVVWATVKDHGGFIDLSSDPKNGTCFELYFPFMESDLTISTGQLSSSNYGGTESILMVDNIAGQRNIANRFFKN
jgi:PAS domain S-box-containing protein